MSQRDCTVVRSLPAAEWNADSTDWRWCSLWFRENNGCFRDSHRGRLKFQTNASIKTWCGAEQGAISGFWISGSHYGRTKRQWMPNRIVKWNYNCKDPLRKPSGCQRSSASLQRRCNLWYQMCFWQLTHVNYSHLFKTCADTATERPLRYIRPITTNDNLLSLQAVK